MANSEDVRPIDPGHVRRAFGTLTTRVSDLEGQVKRALRLAQSAERKAEDSRLDAHAAEIRVQTCKLDYDSLWRFLQKAMEDIMALRGRLRALEHANEEDPGESPGGGLEGAGDGDGGSVDEGAVAGVAVSGAGGGDGGDV